MSINALNPYLQGKRNPGAKVQQKLRILGASIDWILTGEGEMHKSSSESSEKPAETSVKSIDIEQLMAQAQAEVQADYSRLQTEMLSQGVFLKEKFERMIWYIIHSCYLRDPDALGLTKLHKMLYFSEKLVKSKMRKSIAGETYTRRRMGPMSNHLSEALRELEQMGAIEVGKRRLGEGIEQTLFRAYDSPNLSGFDAEEISCIEKTITRLLHMSAQEVSDLSHDDTWQNTPDGEQLQP